MNNPNSNLILIIIILALQAFCCSADWKVDDYPNPIENP